MPAALTLISEHVLRLAHDDVVYQPVPNDAALGALLFALQPDEVEFTGSRYADRATLQLALATARQYARILARHAARAERAEALLAPSVTVEAARAWVHAAGATVPEAERERFCWRLAQRLGERPWCDDSPTIEIAGQQFGLFGDSFSDVEKA